MRRRDGDCLISFLDCHHGLGGVAVEGHYLSEFDVKGINDLKGRLASGNLRKY